MYLFISVFRMFADLNCPEVGYCAPALGYVDFRLGWVGLGQVVLAELGWVDLS